MLEVVSGVERRPRPPERSMAALGQPGWGTMILVGLLAARAAFLVSGFAGMATAKLRRAYETAGPGAAATPESEQQLARFRRRLSMLGYLNALLIVIAVGSMAVARFV